MEQASPAACAKVKTPRRIKVANRFQWKCHWCGQGMRTELGYQNTATIEHLVPRSLGGSNGMNNLAAACRRCNFNRGVMRAEEFAIIARGYRPDRRTEDEFKRHLQLKEHQVERKNAIAAVLNTYLVVVSEIFRNLVATVNPPEGDQKFFENCLANIEEIRIFTNEAMNRVSKMYKKCSVPHVNIDYSVM